MIDKQGKKKKKKKKRKVITECQWLVEAKEA
jgi:hypothetical protein